MSKPETEFSKYATAFFEIIDGAKSGKASFVKDLLKMGLTKRDKSFINETFPTMNNSKGQSFIEKGKSDQLRKYLRGDNDISVLVSHLETEFDDKFRERYCEELQDYDESRIIKFAQNIRIDVNLDDGINTVLEAIADYYSSLIKRAATQKRSTSQTSKDNPKTEGNSVAPSYTITEIEKKAIINLCQSIKSSLSSLTQQTDEIVRKQTELKRVANSEVEERWSKYLECDIKHLKKLFEENYCKLEKHCSDVVELLMPKKNASKSFDDIISIAQNIGCDEYKISSIDKFDYGKFSLMISNFNDRIKRTLRVIDKL